MVLIALANSRANSPFPPGGCSGAGAWALPSPSSVELDLVSAACDSLRPGLSPLAPAVGGTSTSRAVSSLFGSSLVGSRGSMHISLGGQALEPAAPLKSRG
ncbi:MAG: hypothetical protein ACK56I_31810, partial [bacterium]